MQINVRQERVEEVLAQQIAALTHQNARLVATNEALSERLQEYVDRDNQNRSANASENGSVRFANSD